MNLFKALFNRFRSASDAAAKAVSDPVANNRFAIQDAEKMAQDFRQKIASGLASLKQLQNQEKSLKDNIDKYTTIAERAAAAGNDDDAVEALTKKKDFQRRYTALRNQISSFNSDITKQRSRLAQIEQEIENAKSNAAVSELRYAGAKAHKDFVESTTDFGSGNNPLKDLNDLNAESERLEAEAEAMEEIAGTDKPSLDDKYLNDTSSDVAAELAALKKKQSKKTSK